MKKVISGLFILVGALFLMTPFITEKIVEAKKPKISLESLPIETIKENLANEESIDFQYEEIEDINIGSVIKSAFEENTDSLIGILLIPSLDINLPIYKGVNDSNLMRGVSTMKPDQKMGLNNYSLAGHNMKNKSLLFGSLMDIEEGAQVYMSDGQYIYEYIIEKNEIVADTSLEMIDIDRYDHASISLMTCYGTSKSGKRFFSIGKLVDQYPLEEGLVK